MVERVCLRQAVSSIIVSVGSGLAEGVGFGQYVAIGIKGPLNDIAERVGQAH